MSQGVLGFKQEEEKRDTGMTGLAGLDGCADVIILDVAEHSGWGLRGGSVQGSEGRGVLQDTAPQGSFRKGHW